MGNFKKFLPDDVGGEAQLLFFFFCLTYAHKEQRMKEREMRCEGSGKQVQNKGG